MKVKGIDIDIAICTLCKEGKWLIIRGDEGKTGYKFVCASCGIEDKQFLNMFNLKTIPIDIDTIRSEVRIQTKLEAPDA